MGLNLFNKLQKLKIHGYKNRLRVGLPEATFKAMFNPASLSMSHGNQFHNLQGINTTGRVARYSHTAPPKIKLDLVMDGTGVTDYGGVTVLGLGAASVATQIKTFMDLCFYMDGKLHEPKFLKIQWGTSLLKDFNCRLQSVDIEYTSFEKSGAPLHAVLKTTFVEDESPTTLALKAGKSSPDLSHVRVVKSGDTLPLLTKDIYGSSAHYLRVAEVNGLDDFRCLIPGQELLFPPSERESTGEAASQ